MEMALAPSFSNCWTGGRRESVEDNNGDSLCVRERGGEKEETGEKGERERM